MNPDAPEMVMFTWGQPFWAAAGLLTGATRSVAG